MPTRLPALVHIRLDATPWPDDPSDADEYYRALGIATVAWGRLDGHVTACLLQIWAIRGETALASDFPVSWKKRAAYWRVAFKTTPALASYRDHALQLISEIMSETKARHYLAHALWREFKPNPRLTMRAIAVRLADEQGGVFLNEFDVTIDDLDAARGAANRLNRELGIITRYLASLRSEPSATQKA